MAVKQNDNEESKKTLREYLGIVERVPSRFDPDRHDPEWSSDMDLQIYKELTSLNPCPIPVAGKLAMRVRFTLSTNGDEEHARRVEEYERDLLHWDSRGPLAMKPSPPVREHCEWFSCHEYWDGAPFPPHVKCSDPVLEQYMREGGWVVAGYGNSKTRIEVLHLGGPALDDSSVPTLCGRHGRASYPASYAGYEDHLEPYKVCSHCRRVAEARFKRKTKKRSPKGPKGPTPAQLRARAEEEARLEALLAKHEQERIDRVVNNCQNMRAIAERHYTEKADGSRDRFLDELVRYIETGDMP